MLRNSIAERQEARDAIHHHFAHDVVFVCVGVHVLHPSKARVGFVVVVEGADGLDDVFTKLGDLELLAQEIQVEQWANILFSFGVAQGAAVEPTNEELEGEVVGVGEAEGLAGGGFVRFFVVEAGAEEGGVVAEELLVQDPVRIFGADVNVY